MLKRNDVAKKEVELERLQMALKDNILTAEVKTNGYGGVDMDRLDKSIDQIALTYQFKNAKPKARTCSTLVPAARGRPQGELSRSRFKGLRRDRLRRAR